MLLAPDGKITADGVVVGQAVGSGARVHVSYPDGRAANGSFAPAQAAVVAAHDRVGVALTRWLT